MYKFKWHRVAVIPDLENKHFVLVRFTWYQTCVCVCAWAGGRGRVHVHTCTMSCYLDCGIHSTLNCFIFCRKLRSLSLSLIESLSILASWNILIALQHLQRFLTLTLLALLSRKCSLQKSMSCLDSLALTELARFFAWWVGDVMTKLPIMNVHVHIVRPVQWVLCQKVMFGSSHHITTQTGGDCHQMRVNLSLTKETAQMRKWKTSWSLSYLLKVSSTHHW